MLNYLSGKDPSKNIDKYGEVLVNGIDRSKIDFKRYVGYVQQEDVLYQTLTVREWLEFAARMKLPPSINHREKVEAIFCIDNLNKSYVDVFLFDF